MLENHATVYSLLVPPALNISWVFSVQSWNCGFHHLLISNSHCLPPAYIKIFLAKCKYPKQDSQLLSWLSGFSFQSEARKKVFQCSSSFIQRQAFIKPEINHVSKHLFLSSVRESHGKLAQGFLSEARRDEFHVESLI